MNTKIMVFLFEPYNAVHRSEHNINYPMLTLLAEIIKNADQKKLSSLSPTSVHHLKYGVKYED